MLHMAALSTAAQAAHGRALHPTACRCEAASGGDGGRRGIAARVKPPCRGHASTFRWNFLQEVVHLLSLPSHSHSHALVLCPHGLPVSTVFTTVTNGAMWIWSPMWVFWASFRPPLLKSLFAKIRLAALLRPEGPHRFRPYGPL